MSNAADLRQIVHMCPWLLPSYAQCARISSVCVLRPAPANGIVLSLTGV
jgi:hypothetical protein